MIPNHTVEQIKAAARIEDFVGETAKSYGQNKLFCECPVCHHHNTRKKEGLIISTEYNSAQCFKCGQKYGGAIDYVMKTRVVDYPEALRIVAAHYGIFIEETVTTHYGTLTDKTVIEPKARKPRTAKIAAAKVKTAVPVPVAPVSEAEPTPETPKKVERNQGREVSFCDRQLAESGLTYEDLQVEYKENDETTRFVAPFIQGTKDQYGNFVEGKGDDVLIRYYDLDGKPVMYKTEKSKEYRPLVRVRWQNPEAHKDKNGKPKKYESPYGSGTHIYIPEAIRRMYKQGRKIKRLYIQEGEKKAEKCCKHGLFSIAVQGISSIGNKDALPEEIQLIVQRCEVEETVFLMDSDWENLSPSLKTGQAVDGRPLSFFYAVKSYREYLRTLANLGCPVEIYWGHVNALESGSKGVDDLLTVDLAGREPVLLEDVEFALNEKKGVGAYVSIHKITMMPDSKLADYWLLNDSEAFAARHKELLKPLKEFKIKGILRRFNERGQLEMAQALLPEEEFWVEKTKTSRSGDEVNTTLEFNYVKAMTFLQNRGFFRYLMKSGEKVIVRVENRVVTTIDHTEVKDFVKEFCFEIKRVDVLNMLMRGGPQYLGPEKLSNLNYTRPRFDKATSEKQCLFFEEKVWEITAAGIKELNYGQYPGHVWSENIIKHKVKALPALLKVERMTEQFIKESVSPDLRSFTQEFKDEFSVEFTENGEKCHFLQFLFNASEMDKKGFIARRNMAEKAEAEGINIGTEEFTRECFSAAMLRNKHLVNKLTAIGYLLHDYKNDSERKAVVAMDGRLSEVGASNGRSGKSLAGKAISKVLSQVVIDGKNKKLEDDNFRYHEVTEKTRNIFFDDVRTNFEFESLFAIITGALTVNQKAGSRFTLDDDETPKILITTNHAVGGTGASFTDRQAFMVFSDWYNDNWKPINDFGINFFSEWGEDQWNLFYNLMAACLVLYFRAKAEGWTEHPGKTGIVNPPMDNVNLRKLRQTMGENFLSWAEIYFDWNPNNKMGNLNEKKARKELYDMFCDEHPNERKYTPQPLFKKKMEAFVEYKGYHFNPHKYNKEGLTFADFVRTCPGQSFFGEAEKSGGKEYWTIANEDFV